MPLMPATASQERRRADHSRSIPSAPAAGRGRAPIRTAGFCLTLVAACCAAWGDPQSPAGPTGSDKQGLQISSELRVQVQRGREIELQALVSAGDDYSSLAERFAGASAQAEALAAWNGELTLEDGDWVTVPFVLLSSDYRALVLRSLFPDDRRDAEDWVHLARSGRLATYDEGLWEVAEWFTGRGENFRALMQANRLSSPELRAGQAIRIPAGLLHPAFRAGLLSDDGELEYGSDEQGPYAGYRLKAGEALYSAVVGRFTGRTGADDVRELAAMLGPRSGIRDLRDIPVGYLIKIPLDYLEPQYLPAGHPRRIEAEAARRELEQSLARKPVDKAGRGLQNVLIIIDPGHGGRDLGTMNNGVWEHDYVYDVACRLRRKLEEETAAEVRMTLTDMEEGCEPSKTDKLKANRQGTILTTPPFLAREVGEARVGVNLRWYLANSIYREALANGIDRDRVVFLSLHADSRHPSLRGVMVYVPGAAYRTRTYGSNSKTYRRYKEVREKPQVRYSKKDRVRSEAVSTKYADKVVRAFRDEKLPVQPYQPVRNRIIRGKSVFVPAVLRGNAVPNKVLVEMVNLSNREDAELLAAARHRDRLAEALFRSLLTYYGDD
jgi:N-acetylmuramoyl-L-alanine amidase